MQQTTANHLRHAEQAGLEPILAKARVVRIKKVVRARAAKGAVHDEICWASRTLPPAKRDAVSRRLEADGTSATAFLIFLCLLPARADQRTYRVPFRTVGGRILIDVTVEGKPKTLLVDSGARVSMLLGSACQLWKPRLHAQTLALSCQQPEITAAYLKEDAVHFDGFFGQDLMSKFSCVCIDYREGMVELLQ